MKESRIISIILTGKKAADIRSVSYFFAVKN